jgi:hypothetical protein
LKEILVKLKNGSAPHRLNKGILEDMNWSFGGALVLQEIFLQH